MARIAWLPSEARRRDARFAALVLASAILVLAAGGCAGDRLRPFGRDAASLPPTTHRSAHAPYGTLALRRLEDRRSGRERGHENYLNASWYSDQLFAHPVPELVGTVLLRDLRTAGVFRGAASPDEARYLLDVGIAQFHARVDRDLLGFIPVIPSLEIQGRVVLDLRLTDHDGRPFLERRFEATETHGAAAIEGTEGTAAELLLALLARVSAEATAEIDRTVDRFWRDLGRDPTAPD